MAQRGKKQQAMPAFPSDFIALGTKSSGSGGAKGVQANPSQLGGGGGKKQKLGRPSPPPPNVVATTSSTSTSSTSMMNMPTLVDKTHVWESLAVDLLDGGGQLVSAVEEAEEAEDGERIESLLCGAVKLLRGQRAKPDPLLYLSLMYLAKRRDYLFVSSEYVLEAFCSLLKRDVKEAYKSKGNALVSVLAANVLMAAMRAERHWPEILVRVYIDDAMGERVWVDHPDCKGFVDNICTAFKTRLPQNSANNVFFTGGGQQTKTSSGDPSRESSSPGPPGDRGSRSGSGSATPTRPGTDDDSSLPATGGEHHLPINVVSGGDTGGIPPTALPDSGVQVQVVARFESSAEATIEQLVLEIVREQFNRRQGTDNITRNFLKFLTSACGLVEVRQLVVPKLEMWIMNPKVSRPAQELLMAVAMNCTTHSLADVEVITGFTKLRFKNKPNVNLFLQCVRELCAAHRDNLPTLLKQTVFNELSNARNTNNMAMFAVMFSYDHSVAPASLANVFVDLLMQKECYLRALRALLREIVRALRYDVNLHTFCVHLMQLPGGKDLILRDFEFKERMFTSLTDVISLAMFLGISPAVRESMTAYFRGDDKRDLSPYKHFLKQVALIQRDAMVWMLESVLKTYKPDTTNVYPQCVHKLLFMVNSEEYWRVDGWPADSDRGLYFKATSEIPLLQETLCHIFVIGVSKHHPINGRDTIDLAECLVKRAAALHPLISEDFQVLSADKVTQIMEILFQLAAYYYPDSITLPVDYSPPKMAIATAYWKVWQILVLLCAHNPSEFGAAAWESYPTLRAMMEMCITNQFLFPPPTMASGEQADEIRAKDVQTTTLERQDILQFEIHLAAATNKATITEATSLLLAQLITNHPEGELRRPPQAVLDQLSQANQHFKIGHLLCRSRSPDFLLDILQRQGTNQAMPWLADLVESSEGSLNILPVQCLCEFLLNSTTSFDTSNEDVDEEMSAADKEAKVVKKRKQKQLLVHLQNLLQNPASDQQRSCMETLDYFLRRLSSQQTHQRLQALRGLRLVLSPIKDDTDEDDVEVVMMQVDGTKLDSNNEWLLQRLPSLPCFASCYPQISNALRIACQVENDPNAVSLYIQFLAHYAPEAVTELADLCLDISSIIVERSTLLPAILPGGLCKTTPQVATETYTSLLRLFLHYMRRVRRRGQPPSQWNNDTQEMIAVYWATEQTSATIHFFIVHAQIILLTYGPQQLVVNSKEEECLFSELLSFWHPPRGEMPRAYLVDSNKEVVLIPDWLKLKMIRSDVGVLVDAALVELDPQQLVLFIQSFGIPVASMSKLLQALDRTIRTDFEGVNEAVMDKTYMGQLVAVQHQRGARGGHVFADKLGLNLAAHQTKMELDAKNVLKVGGRPPIVVPPRSTAMIPPVHVKNTLQHLFDVGSPSRMTLKEKQDTFRTLQKYLTSEVSSNAPTRPMLNATVAALEAILLKSANDIRHGFVTALVQRTAFSCSLLRLLTSALSKAHMEDDPAAEKLNTVAEYVIKEMKARGTVATSNPLAPLLENYVTKRLNKMGGRSKKTTFEQTVQAQVEEALRKKSTGSLVESMARQLAIKKKKEEASFGLLIDWLQRLDPELRQVNCKVRQQLLFGKANAHPHLLTLLSHMAGWDSLRSTVAEILSSGSTNFEDYDPEAVLDFLSTCVYLRMQWQSRDKHVPKHDSGPQDVLNLTEDEVNVMLDYCLQEAYEKQQQQQQQQQDISTKKTIGARISLIAGCLVTKAKAAKAIDHLISKLYIKKSKVLLNAEKELMLQIYMRLPHCLLHVVSPEDHVLPEAIDNEGYTSVVDCVSHSLLAALAATQQGKAWTNQMVEFECGLRKLASTHPLLILRNLPLLAAGLKGRTDYDFSFFRSRNHLTYYSMALGVLELTAPHVFRPEHKQPLEDALKCYMQMLRSYINRCESFVGLVDKIAAFLHLYLDNSASLASEFIRKHGRVLRLYQKQFPNSQAVKQLVSVVSFPEDEEEEESKDEVVATVTNGVSTFTSMDTTACQMNARRLFTSLNNAADDDLEMAEVLGQLREMAQKQPNILVHFAEDIAALLSHPTKSIRQLAFDLMMRLWRHSPKASSSVLVPAYIGCLESSDPAVASAALEKLPDVAPLAQDRLSDVLGTAFGLGLYSGQDVGPYICEALAMLNTQSGY